METWRVLAAVLLGAGGIVLVLLTMARTRDRRGATGGQVAVNGTIAFTILVVLCVLTLTVFSPAVAWSVAGGVAAVVGVMLLAS
ncbi:hypothetical protein [Actinophytocola gossypii]|uniref:Uncharacterized protein n=1 Tax=Actinophytocola gossypii TaxID=2812003 RepID=A0ABT2J3M3_9PSEU|nr:hypothetical protein [Actinophytocola gossypii]MCT2582464.1 hypothetical protein [Actinophytocola gossypii]